MKKMSKTTLVLYAVIGIAAIACLALLLLPKEPPAPSEQLVAVLWVDGDVFEEIPLGTAEDGTFSILDSTGHNITFEIKDHAIRFLESDCPDQVCVNTGFVSQYMDLAACLPNQTVLSVELRQSP